MRRNVLPVFLGKDQIPFTVFMEVNSSGGLSVRCARNRFHECTFSNIVFVLLRGRKLSTGASGTGPTVVQSESWRWTDPGAGIVCVSIA